MGEDNVIHDKKSNNKRFAILSLIPVLILNLILRDLFMNMYHELIRYLQNGFQPQVLKFLLEEFAWWFGISSLVFLCSFCLFKAVEAMGKTNNPYKLNEIENGGVDMAKKVKCTKCNSLDLQFMGNNKKAFSAGKAVGGAILTGGIGALAGFAGKKGRDQWRCNDCGEIFETKR